MLEFLEELKNEYLMYSETEQEFLAKLLILTEDDE